MMEEDIFKGLGVEVKLRSEEDFLKIKETLTRIGVASRKDKVLWQSTHILHKQGRYAIMHFKELFKMDGRPSDITENDIARRNTITILLEEWELLSIKDVSGIENLTVPLNQIKILTHKEKNDWICEAKYSIGTKKYK